MKKTIAAMAALVMMTTACDPWLEDCTPRGDLPSQGYGLYYMHGIVSWIQSFYMFGIMGAYSSSLSLFGTAILAGSWGIAAANLAAYLPVAIVWTLTAITSDVGWYKAYYGWLSASNIYGYILTAVNAGWYVILIIGIFLPIF